MLILRQSTAIDIRMGPFVDATDGVTPETGITLAGADQAEVLKENGAATVAMAGTFAAVTGADGWFDYTAATGDVDTVGEVVFVVQDSSVCLPVFVRAMVVEEAIYDGFYDAGSIYTEPTGDAYARLGAPAGASVSADVAAVPTVAEMNARTLVAASYFDPAADTVATVTTLTGHTVQTGDNYARLGAPAGASVSADIAVIEGQTNDIGVAGAGLTAINLPNQTMDITGSLSGSVGSVTGNVGGIAGTINDFDGLDTALDSAHGAGSWLSGSSTALVTGTADSGTTTTMVDAARTEADTDFWKGAWIRFTSGNLDTQPPRLITGFVPATDTITFTPAATQAVATHTYEIMPAASIDVASWIGVVVANALETAVDVRTEMDSNSTRLATLAGGIIEGVTTGTPTTTSTNTDLTGYLDGELEDRLIVFTGGIADGQAATILTYTATSGVVTFAALTTAPAASDSFKIV